MTIKKLAFAPFFIIFFTILIYQLTPLLKSYDFIFSLSVNTLIELIILAVFISLTSFFFTLFATLAQDWKLILPVALVSAIIPFIFIEPALALILTVAIFVCLVLTSLSLESHLKTYLNFQPANLLGPSIKRLSGLLIISFCLVYFFSSSKLISQNGFSIPDSLIDTALKMSPTNIPEQTSTSQLPGLSSDQIALLKKNPDLLQQFGLDSKMLDSLVTDSQKTAQPASKLGNDFIKQTVKSQIQEFIKPYLNFIPAILALLLFLTFQSLVAFLNILIYPLLWLTFLILEKTGFTRFEIEQRPVKKLVV